MRQQRNDGHRPRDFQLHAGPGWTLMALSHDYGATGGCDAALRFTYPGSDPDVVSVWRYQSGSLRRRHLRLRNCVGRQHLSGACSHNSGGSGGGCSSKFAAPGYQSSPYCGAGSRSVPDISLKRRLWPELLLQRRPSWRRRHQHLHAAGGRFHGTGERISHVYRRGMRQRLYVRLCAHGAGRLGDVQGGERRCFRWKLRAPQPLLRHQSGLQQQRHHSALRPRLLLRGDRV